ncbi:MAG TPA: biotin transporter BioY [Actinomycetota bacterium]|nr:biotin transporter BioY [Actinomycetota bacterium]
MSTLVETLAPARGGSRARVAYSVALVAGGSLLMAGLAQLSIKLPFTPVPITGQTLGALLIGASFGPWLGGAALALYLVEGWVGLPFYAQGQHGTTATLFHPSVGLASAGYLWGFILAAVVVGWLAHRGWDRNLRSAIGAMFLGELVLYAVGLVWLATAINVPIVGNEAACNFSSGAGCDALQLGLYPFLIGDVLKLLLAAVLLPTAWRLTKGRRTPRGD